MVRIRNGIGGLVALAASLLLAVTPALGQDHGGYHGGGGHSGYMVAVGITAVAITAATVRLTPTTPCRSIGLACARTGAAARGGAWVRPWGPRWVPHTWGGGYWHGGFWPHVYLGWDFPWFLPILPVGYATYWWGGVPYYYTAGRVLRLEP